MAANVEVLVGTFDDIEHVLRKFKKRVERSGTWQDMKKHSYYVKPSDARRSKMALARKKARKRLVQQREHDDRLDGKRRQDDPMRRATWPK